MRRLVALVVTLALLAAADSTARVFAAARLGTALSSGLDLETAPEVTIGGFPFLWGLARGTLEEMTISVDELGGEVVTLGRVEVTLNDVSFSRVEALTGDLRRVRAASGRGTARLSVTALEDAVGGGLLGDISVSDLPGIDVTGTTLSVGSIAFELPVLVKGMAYDTARLVDGSVHLTFRLRKTTLSLR